MFFFLMAVVLERYPANLGHSFWFLPQQCSTAVSKYVISNRLSEMELTHVKIPCFAEQAEISKEKKRKGKSEHLIIWVSTNELSRYPFVDMRRSLISYTNINKSAGP